MPAIDLPWPNPRRSPTNHFARIYAVSYRTSNCRHTVFSNFTILSSVFYILPSISHPNTYTLLVLYTKTLALIRFRDRSLGFYPTTDIDAENSSPWYPRLGSRLSFPPTPLFQGAQKDITPNELATPFYYHIQSSNTTPA